MELTILAAIVFFVMINRMWKKITKWDAEMENIYKNELKKRNKWKKRQLCGFYMYQFASS